MIQTAFMSALFTAIVCNGSQLSPELQKKYLAKWDRQKQEIVSGQIEFYWFRGATNARNLDAQDVSSIFGGWNHLSTTCNLEELIAKLFHINNPNEKKIKTGKLWLEGQRFREELGDNPIEMIRLFDGEQEISVTPSNHQILIHNVGASRIGSWSLAQFLHIPRIAPDSSWELARTQGNIVRMTNISDRKGTISSRGAFVDFDAETGIVTYLEGKVNDQVRYQYFQGPVKEYPNAIKMPTWSAKIQFGTNGRFKNIQIACIRDAVFNVPVPLEKFKFATPAGYKVIDHRTQPPRSVVDSPKSDDVLQLLGKDSPMPSSVKPSAWAILVIVACGFCVMAVLIVRRRNSGLSG